MKELINIQIGFAELTVPHYVRNDLA